ncbi:MAG: AmmeMemoRadiSam system protein B [Anaerolineae bacterium]
MDVRPSPIAGTWYPGDAGTLTRTLSRYLAAAKAWTPPGKLWGLMVPHAGHSYSGPVAAYAYRSLQGVQPALVVILSPMHQAHHAPLLTTGHDAYQTPLGIVEVDGSALESLNLALRSRLGYGMTPIRYDAEHAIEIQLPFLQHCLSRFRLLPVMIRDQRSEVVHALGLALAEVLQGRNCLLVASSDLSHFYPQKIACDFDTEMLRRLAAFDPQGVLAAEAEGAGFACGRGAVAAVLWAAEQLGANHVRILRHATSGEVTGDYEAVVGYGAAVIWGDQNGETGN